MATTQLKILQKFAPFGNFIKGYWFQAQKVFQNYLNFPKKFPLKLCNSLKLNILEIGLILCSVLPPESVDLPLLGNVYKQNLNLGIHLEQSDSDSDKYRDP